jgi:hypothetical protein
LTSFSSSVSRYIRYSFGVSGVSTITFCANCQVCEIHNEETNGRERERDRETEKNGRKTVML